MKPQARHHPRKPQPQPEQAGLQPSSSRGPQTRTPSRKPRGGPPVDPVLAAERLHSFEVIRGLQQSLGNQQVVRLAVEAAAPAEAAAEGGAREAVSFRYAGFRERHVRSLEEDTRFQEARATGMSEIRVWERRRSRRTLRTTLHSAQFYDWLESRVSNFPGHLRLNDNQYWELNPNSGRLRLVTVHVALELPGEEKQPPSPGSPEAAADPIYARYYELYGPFAPWVSPEEARMRVQQADPEEARRMRARGLMPQYLMWLAVGGDRREESYKIPATWYLNQQPDRLNWSLNEYFTLKAMHGASERMRAMPILAEASANLTNFILSFPTEGIKELIELGWDFVGDWLFEQVLEILKQLGVSEETINKIKLARTVIQGVWDIKDFFSTLLEDGPEVDKGKETIEFVSGLFETGGEIASILREEEPPSPVVEVGMDDAGFWAECGQTRMQEKYFYHFVASNLTFLRQFLETEGVADEDVYMIMAREAEQMKHSRPLFEE